MRDINKNSLNASKGELASPGLNVSWRTVVRAFPCAVLQGHCPRRTPSNNTPQHTHTHRVFTVKHGSVSIMLRLCAYLHVFIGKQGLSLIF